MIDDAIATAIERAPVQLVPSEEHALSREVSHSIDAIPAADIISEVLDADVERVRRILDDCR